MNDYDRATIYGNPEADGGRYGLYIGDWKDGIQVEGFETALEAYYWCVQTIHIDPLHTSGIPEQLRTWIHDMPTDELDGLPLFAQGVMA